MDEYSPTSSLDSSPISSDVNSNTNSECSEGEQDGVREQFRTAKCKRYLSGKSRKVYKIRKDLDKSFTNLPYTPWGVFLLCLCLSSNC